MSHLIWIYSLPVFNTQRSQLLFRKWCSVSVFHIMVQRQHINIWLIETSMHFVFASATSKSVLTASCTVLTKIIVTLLCVMPGGLSCIFHIPYTEGHNSMLIWAHCTESRFSPGWLKSLQLTRDTHVYLILRCCELCITYSAQSHVRSADMCLEKQL